MNRQHIIIVIGLIAAVLGGLYLLVHFKKAELQDALTDDDTEVAGYTVDRINAKHYFKEEGSVHTIAGEIMLPTPCDLLDSNVVLLDNKMRAMIAFETINNSEGDSEACAQVMTPQRFKVGFSAPKDVQMEAMFNGAPVILNLVPAAEGEDPADFELFIKG